MLSPLGRSCPIVPLMPCIGDLDERTSEGSVWVSQEKEKGVYVQLWLVPSGEVTRLGSWELSSAAVGFVFVRWRSSPESSELLPNPLDP